MLDAALSTALLAIAIAVVLLPLRSSAWSLVPLALSAIALAAGVVEPSTAQSAARSLAAPLAFVLLAVPLAVLLDDLGFFGELAGLLALGRRYRAWLWLLAAAVTAFLNLDAAVVLLTPLYVRIAVRRGTSAFALALQPALLSGLASSALPISNLTNLIAASRLHLGASGFLVHLGPPTVVAILVGLVCYLLAYDDLARHGPSGPKAASASSSGGPDASTGSEASGGPEASGGAGEGHAPPAGANRQVLALGGAIVVLVVTGFLLVPLAGGQPWQVAAAADLVLAATLRRVPLRAVPWPIVLAVLGLGVLASAVASHLPLHALVGGAPPAALVRTTAVGTGASDVVNNLPALLVGLPGLPPGPSWGAWSLLLGTNLGALLVPSGSLAVLLWLSTLSRLGVPVAQHHWLRVAVRVALPGLLAGLTMLLVLRVALGPGQ